MNMRTISTTLRKLGKFTNSALVCNIVITVHYLPRCLSQETVKGPFSLRVNLPPPSHTQWRLHTLPFHAERQAGKFFSGSFACFT